METITVQRISAYIIDIVATLNQRQNDVDSTSQQRRFIYQALNLRSALVEEQNM